MELGISKEEQLAIYEENKAKGFVESERLFVGKNFSDEVGLFIQDKDGNQRIRIFVDKDNQCHMDFWMRKEIQ